MKNCILNVFLFLFNTALLHYKLCYSNNLHVNLNTIIIIFILLEQRLKYKKYSACNYGWIDRGPKITRS